MFLTSRVSGWTRESNRLKKSISREDPFFESAARFFVIILKFILTSLFEIKIHEKNSLTSKNFIFEGRFYKATDSYPDSLGVNSLFTTKHKKWT